MHFDRYCSDVINSTDGHSSRVGALAWNSHLLTSGGRDNLVINHDVRIQNHIVGKMAGNAKNFPLFFQLFLFFLSRLSFCSFGVANRQF
jgi:WD40 repeat protein